MSKRTQNWESGGVHSSQTLVLVFGVLGNVDGVVLKTINDSEASGRFGVV
jgi:hypothetical protein